MERSPYAPMTPSTEGPNPLRPYYRPPSIGIGNASGPESAAKYNTNNSFRVQPDNRGQAASSFGSSARDILSDLDYREILRESGGQSTAATVKGLLDQAVWKYSSVFMAQPFELAKMVLQARLASEAPLHLEDQSRRRSGAFADARYLSSHDEFEDDDEEPSYFTSTAPGLHRSMSPLSPSLRSRRSTSRSASGLSPLRQPTTPPVPPHMLDLKTRDSLMEVISQLWAKEGAWGTWKGTNVSFLYSLLFKTTETWTRSMLSAIFNLPDPGIGPSSGMGVGGLDIIDSPAPLISLFIAVTAAGVSGFFLSPLDIIRTRLMLTTTSEQPRSLIHCLRSLPSWVCPPSLFAPTILHSTLPTLISTSAPLILRSALQIDPLITPATYSVCTFLSSTFELFVKLPLETVLRRGQIKYVTETSSPVPVKGRSRRAENPSQAGPMLTVVEVGSYYGVLQTMWHIARDEGETVQTIQVTSRGGPPGTPARKNSVISSKGQGIQGLWRGWRVGWWGLVGVWGAAALGGGAKGGEF